MNRFNRHRRDTNHREIVDALVGCGCSVRDCSQLGDAGGPDLLVGMSGRDYQVEIKSEHGDLSDDQRDFIAAWRGQQITVLWSPDDAIRWVNMKRAGHL